MTKKDCHNNMTHPVITIRYIKYVYYKNYSVAFIGRLCIIIETNIIILYTEWNKVWKCLIISFKIWDKSILG